MIADDIWIGLNLCPNAIVDIDGLYSPILHIRRFDKQSANRPMAVGSVPHRYRFKLFSFSIAMHSRILVG